LFQDVSAYFSLLDSASRSAESTCCRLLRACLIQLFFAESSYLSLLRFDNLSGERVHKRCNPARVELGITASELPYGLLRNATCSPGCFTQTCLCATYLTSYASLGLTDAAHALACDLTCL
tara:strand:+ start:204 stop:566 length:363 start_codon:yes stop_codon:yes gene_type:complete